MSSSGLCMCGHGYVHLTFIGTHHTPHTHTYTITMDDSFSANLRVCLRGLLQGKLGTVSGMGMSAVGAAGWQKKLEPCPGNLGGPQLRFSGLRALDGSLFSGQALTLVDTPWFILSWMTYCESPQISPSFQGSEHSLVAQLESSTMPFPPQTHICVL